MTEHPETPPSAPKQNRRKFLRTPLIVQRVYLDDDRRTFFGYAKNISRGGLFISATSPKEVGDRFRLEIPLPPPIDLTIRCGCEVVWNRQWSRKSTAEPGMGLRFLDLPEDDGEAIDRWIAESQRLEKLGR